MISVRLNYALLQVINAVFSVLSYLFIIDYFQPDGTKTWGVVLLLFLVFMAGLWVFYTNRIFYVLIKHSQS